MLGDILEKEEQASNYEKLSLIFAIFKNILLISNQAVLEMFVLDEFYEIIFTALECNNNIICR